MCVYILAEETFLLGIQEPGGCWEGAHGGNGLKRFCGWWEAPAQSELSIWKLGSWRPLASVGTVGECLLGCQPRPFTFFIIFRSVDLWHTALSSVL